MAHGGEFDKGPTVPVIDLRGYTLDLAYAPVAAVLRERLGRPLDMDLVRNKALQRLDLAPPTDHGRLMKVENSVSRWSGRSRGAAGDEGG